MREMEFGAIESKKRGNDTTCGPMCCRTGQSHVSVVGPRLCVRTGLTYRFRAWAGCCRRKTMGAGQGKRKPRLRCKCLDATRCRGWARETVCKYVAASDQEVLSKVNIRHECI